MSGERSRPQVRRRKRSAALDALLSRTGFGPQVDLVLYGADENRLAAAAYWLLRWRGLDRVGLLDGGTKRCELEERPTTRSFPGPVLVARRPVPFEPRPELRISLENTPPLPWRRVLQGDGGFRPRDELRVLVTEHAVADRVASSAMPEAGSALVWFALHELLGPG